MVGTIISCQVICWGAAWWVRRRGDRVTHVQKRQEQEVTSGPRSRAWSHLARRRSIAAVPPSPIPKSRSLFGCVCGDLDVNNRRCLRSSVCKGHTCAAALGLLVRGQRDPPGKGLVHHSFKGGVTEREHQRGGRDLR